MSLANLFRCNQIIMAVELHSTLSMARLHRTPCSSVWLDAPAREKSELRNRVDQILLSTYLLTTAAAAAAVGACIHVCACSFVSSLVDGQTRRAKFSAVRWFVDEMWPCDPLLQSTVRLPTLWNDFLVTTVIVHCPVALFSHFICDIVIDVDLWLANVWIALCFIFLVNKLPSCQKNVFFSYEWQKYWWNENSG